MKWFLLLLGLLSHVVVHVVGGDGAVALTSADVDATLAENEFVMINFYADWCRFSNMLAPVWDSFADKAREEFKDSPVKVVVAKIDCDKESE